MSLLFALGIALSACDHSPDAAPASDFAVLAQAAEGYRQAEKGLALSFPRDHGSHPDFRIEWWYLTANLQDARGRPFGAQWTLFRTAMGPPDELASPDEQQIHQVFMAHFALTWPDGHEAFQRYARGGPADESRAGVTASPFSAWLDDWSLTSATSQWLPLEARARQDGYMLSLVLESDQPPVLQGDNGFSQKHPNGGGSFYYSQPFLQATGELTIEGERIPVVGQAWLDHEWSSQFLQKDQAGWDWFALHLDSGEKLMLFRLRGQGGGSRGDFQHGVLIKPDGTTNPLDPSRIGFNVLATEEIAGRTLPLKWRIELPEVNRSLQVEALHPDQWMNVDFPYWEGFVLVSSENPGNAGVGFLELTGYAKQ